MVSACQQPLNTKYLSRQCTGFDYPARGESEGKPGYQPLGKMGVTVHTVSVSVDCPSFCLWAWANPAPERITLMSDTPGKPGCISMAVCSVLPYLRLLTRKSQLHGATCAEKEVRLGHSKARSYSFMQEPRLCLSKSC